MFINAPVFINSSVVYKLRGGGGGAGGGVLEHKLKSPHPLRPLRHGAKPLGFPFFVLGVHLD